MNNQTFLFTGFGINFYRESFFWGDRIDGEYNIVVMSDSYSIDSYSYLFDCG